MPPRPLGTLFCAGGEEKGTEREPCRAGWTPGGTSRLSLPSPGTALSAAACMRNAAALRLKGDMEMPDQPGEETESRCLARASGARGGWAYRRGVTAKARPDGRAALLPPLVVKVSGWPAAAGVGANTSAHRSQLLLRDLARVLTGSGSRTAGWKQDGSRERSLSAGGAQAPHSRSSVRPPPPTKFNCTFTAWHPETGGANRSESERASDPAVPLVCEDAYGDRCDEPDVAPVA